MSVTRRKVRLQVETADFSSPIDVSTQATMQFWRGSGLRLEVGLFLRRSVVSVANLATVRCEIKPQASGGGAPAPATEPLLVEEVNAFDNTLDAASWAAGTKQHAVIEFSGEETNIAIPSGGNLWLVLVATTSDDTEPITLAAGTCKIVEDGWQSGGTAPPVEDTYYTAQQANARFARRAYASNPFFGTATDEQIFGGFAADGAVKVAGIQLAAQTVPTGAALTVCLVDHDDSDAEISGTTATLAAGAGFQETLFGAAHLLAAGGALRLKIKSVGSTAPGAWLDARLILAPVGTDVVDDPATVRSGVAVVALDDDEEIIVVFSTALDEAPEHILLTSYAGQAAWVDASTITASGFTIVLGGPTPAGREVAYRASL